jgi:hypothetical protein
MRQGDFPKSANSRPDATANRRRRQGREHEKPSERSRERGPSSSGWSAGSHTGERAALVGPTSTWISSPSTRRAYGWSASRTRWRGPLPALDPGGCPTIDANVEFRIMANDTITTSPDTGISRLSPIEHEGPARCRRNLLDHREMTECSSMSRQERSVQNGEGCPRAIRRSVDGYPRSDARDDPPKILKYPDGQTVSNPKATASALLGGLSAEQ